ncbi:leucyl aminopeptidase [Nocardioides cynanchi]|uniref:leucyl aminopeptidase n=1 Tax=Nocardioides cynanchi TaxID=2558918 RepID=UPI001247360E|nr:leucyl aminopeptidase [Nocardioides cynanchi]
MTSYHLRGASPAKTRADAVVVGVVKTPKGVVVADGGEDVAAAFGRSLRPLLSTLGFSGKPGDVARIPTGGKLASPLLVLVGMGPATDDRAATLLAVRRAAGVAARSTANAASVALALPAGDAALIRNVTEGYLLGGYTFGRYLSTTPDAQAGTVTVLCPIARRQEAVAAFEEAQVVASAVAVTRDWVNTPAADLTPSLLAGEIVKAAKGTKVKVTVHDEAELAELGCGGLLGVGGGSSAPPRLVELSYSPGKPVAHIALVGKGITFDSGGLTIKPGNGMETMKCDMAGAAAVTQATLAIAALGLPVKVSAFACLAENMVSGSAMRPGDVLTIYGGRTVEVLNTDAEGRLVLADGLQRAVEQEPDVIIDVATLTGHMVMALGTKVGAAFGDDAVVASLIEAGQESGEKHWPMPIPADIVERVHGSKIADLAQHDWTRWGGGLLAAGFLREFTDGVPWAHLDIAGPGFNSGSAAGHLTGGGTGFGLTTLVDYARGLASPATTDGPVTASGSDASSAA